MFVFEQGAGPAIVFIPGLGADHRMYAPQLEALTGFRCLAVDVRGAGRSPSLAGIAVDDVLAVQADEIAEMLNQRGVARAHLVGVSYGGLVIETFMLRRPDLIASAIICDSLCESRPRNLLEGVQMAAARTQPAMLRFLPLRWNNVLMGLIYRGRWPLAAAYLGRLLTKSHLDDVIIQRRVVNSVELADKLGGCTTPTLCLVGGAVPLAEAMMRRVEVALPNTEFAIIPNSFDPSSLCQPELFTQHVRDWVNRHEPGEATTRHVQEISDDPAA